MSAAVGGLTAFLKPRPQLAFHSATLFGIDHFATHSLPRAQATGTRQESQVRGSSGAGVLCDGFFELVHGKGCAMHLAIGQEQNDPLVAHSGSDELHDAVVLLEVDRQREDEDDVRVVHL